MSEFENSPNALFKVPLFENNISINILAIICYELLSKVQKI